MPNATESNVPSTTARTVNSGSRRSGATYGFSTRLSGYTLPPYPYPYSYSYTYASSNAVEVALGTGIVPGEFGYEYEYVYEYVNVCGEGTEARVCAQGAEAA